MVTAFAEAFEDVALAAWAARCSLVHQVIETARLVRSVVAGIVAGVVVGVACAAAACH